jgi:hypothetical protein
MISRLKGEVVDKLGYATLDAKDDLMRCLILVLDIERQFIDFIVRETTKDVERLYMREKLVDNLVEPGAIIPAIVSNLDFPTKREKKGTRLVVHNLCEKHFAGLGEAGGGREVSKAGIQIGEARFQWT